MTISVLQAQGTNANSATSISLAFASNVTAGSLISVMCEKFTPTADSFVLGDCTQAAGTATLTAFSLDESTANAANGTACSAQWSAIVTGAGSLTIQVAGALAGSYLLIGIAEVGGNWDASRVEAHNHNQGDPATVGATANGGSATSAGAAIFFSGVQVNGTSAATTTPDGSATLIYKNETVTDDNGAFIYRIVSTGTTYDPTYALGGTNINAWAATNTVYKEAAGGASVVDDDQGWQLTGPNTNPLTVSLWG